MSGLVRAAGGASRCAQRDRTGTHSVSGDLGGRRHFRTTGTHVTLSSPSAVRTRSAPSVPT